MTNQHPLTDELLQQIGCSNPRARVFDTQAMRAAYDRGRDEQLEQVMKWIEEELPNYAYKIEGSTYLDEDFIYKDLKEAMRPQEDNS